MAILSLTMYFIFRDDSNSFIAKVADFGYSTISTNQGLIYMPKSGCWTAPEWHHRGFDFLRAVKMDVYSFGVLFVWLMFYKGQSNENERFHDYLDSKIRWLSQFEDAFIGTICTSDGRKRHLTTLINITLAPNPNNRTSKIEDCILILTGNP